MNKDVVQFIATGFSILILFIALLVLASAAVAMVVFLVHLIGMLP